MSTINNDVLNQNTLRLKYNGDTPFVEMVIHQDLFVSFRYDHKLELLADLQADNSLKLTVQLKSFRSPILFHTILPSWDNHSLSIRHFLTTFITMEKISVKILSLDKKECIQKFISIPSFVRELSKMYIGEMKTFDENDGLQQSFGDIPAGFLVPYANDSYFLLLCKIDDAFFETIKFIPSKQIVFEVFASQYMIELLLSYKELTIASLRIHRNDICDEITEDFQLLLHHQTIQFAITNLSMTRQQYLSYSQPITEQQQESILHFFHLKKTQQKTRS